MARCPLYSRYRGFFDDTNFGGTMLGGDLFDPTFYQQWFNMQLGHRQLSPQQSAAVCPLRNYSGAYPFRQQAASSRLDQQTGACPFRHQTGASELPQKNSTCPFRQQAGVSRLPQNTSKSTTRKKTGASKLPQQTSTGGVSEHTSAGSLRQRLGTLVTISPGKFSIRVNTRNITPQKISVRTEGNSVVIHGEHSEKPDGSGYHVQREFTRRYELPDDVDPETAKCDLMDNGDLAIEATRKEAPKAHDKPVPIEVQRAPESGDEENSK